MTAYIPPSLDFLEGLTAVDATPNTWEKAPSNNSTFSPGGTINFRIEGIDVLAGPEVALKFKIKQTTADHTMNVDHSAYSVIDRLVIRGPDGNILTEITDLNVYAINMVKCHCDEEYVKTKGALMGMSSYQDAYTAVVTTTGLITGVVARPYFANTSIATVTSAAAGTEFIVPLPFGLFGAGYIPIFATGSLDVDIVLASTADGFVASNVAATAEFFDVRLLLPGLQLDADVKRTLLAKHPVFNVVGEDIKSYRFSHAAASTLNTNPLNGALTRMKSLLMYQRVATTALTTHSISDGLGMEQGAGAGFDFYVTIGDKEFPVGHIKSIKRAYHEYLRAVGDSPLTSGAVLGYTSYSTAATAASTAVAPAVTQNASATVAATGVLPLSFALGIDLEPFGDVKTRDEKILSGLKQMNMSYSLNGAAITTALTCHAYILYHAEWVFDPATKTVVKRS